MSGIRQEEMAIVAKGESLPGTLNLPAEPAGLVLFAHGSGSSRFSPRNRKVAQILNEAGLATLLFDLLSAAEHDRDVLSAEHRFDIPLLSRRLCEAIDWVGCQPAIAHLPLGLFGSSTGAAAALVAAAERPRQVQAVVSRGGRVDLAGEALERVGAPVLMIVGGWDHEVYWLNRDASARLTAPHAVRVIPDASHLFEEPGKLESVAHAAAGWFRHHLAGTQPRLVEERHTQSLPALQRQEGGA